LESLINKKTFLTDPEWCKIPYLENPKSPLDLFLDLFLDGISALHEAEVLNHLTLQGKLSFGVKLLKKCSRFDQQMQQFYADIKDSQGTPMFWPVLSSDQSTKNGHSDSLADVSFEFVDYRAGNMHMLYWATLTVLWSGMSHLHDMISVLVGVIHPTESRAAFYERLEVPHEGHCREFVTPARKVFQSVAYCLRDEMAQRTIVAPLIMISDVLVGWKVYDKELSWIQLQLEKVRRNGMKIIKFLDDPSTSKKRLEEC
jgi:hypothetical protein